jgi:hypothetical protein
MDGMKHCTKCRRDLPTATFGMDRNRKDGRYPYCKQCRSLTGSAAMARSEYKAPPTSKVCRKCRLERPSSAFARRKHSADGLRGECKDCKGAYFTQWRSIKAPKDEKFCPGCGKITPASRFHFDGAAKDLLAWRCKDCADGPRRAATRERIAKWEKACARCSAPLKPSYGIWSQKFCETCRPIAYAENRLANVKAWNARQDPDTRKAKQREHGRRRRQSPQYRVHDTMTSRIHKVLRRRGGKKTLPLHETVPYTHKELVAHLEAQFQPGMSWENYGRKGWHVGHRKPVCRFKFTAVTDKGFQECWALANLFPQWEEENLKAGARREFPAAEHVTATLAPRS